jgi:hemin uptake protein HemP
MTEFARPSTLTLRSSANNLNSPRSHSADRPRAVSAPRLESNSNAEAREERTVRSDALLQGRSHVLITHNGETYQLRATRLGKLILTK